jgi:hypothetical protein
VNENKQMNEMSIVQNSVIGRRWLGEYAQYSLVRHQPGHSAEPISLNGKNGSKTIQKISAIQKIST